MKTSNQKSHRKRSKHKKSPQYRHLLRHELLLAAWEKVRAKGSAGGIDGMGTKEMQERAHLELPALLRELQAGNYRPQPYLEVWIPKDETEKRRLGLLTVRDKIVQQAVLDLVQPGMDRGFLPASYAYRPQKGHQRAVNRVRHAIAHERKAWFLKEDIDNFFDTVDHSRLASQLARAIPDPDLQQLIMLLVKMGRVTRDLRWEDVKQGLPQGGLLSPLLANLYLHPFDQKMQQFPEAFYLRYGDDFLVLCQEKAQCERIRQSIRDYLPRQLGLGLNPDGQLGPISEGVEYLGITFYQDRLELRPKKKAEIEAKIKESIVIQEKSWSPMLRETLGGLGRYYAKVLPEPLLEWMDEQIKEVAKEALAGLPKSRGGKALRKQLIGELRFFSAKYKAAGNATWFQNAKDKAPTLPAERVISPENAIRERKREYQKRYTASLELLVNRPGVFLGISRKGVSVKQKGQILDTIPAANLKFISILGKGVSLSSNLVHHCAREGVPIAWFNRSGNPVAGIRAFDRVEPGRWRAQLQALENGKAAEFARDIVLAKMGNQANLLKYFAKYNVDSDPAFAARFAQAMEGMEAAEDKAKAIPQFPLEELRANLMQLEAQAARHYWEAVQVLLRDQVEFPGRVPRQPKDVVNALLNYGYGILYHRVEDALLRSGLQPAISFLHVPHRGRPTLSYDLIEEFRQRAVDGVVFSMINRGEELRLAEGFLDENSRKRIAEKVLERLNTPEKFRGERLHLSDIIRLQARDLGRYLEGELPSYKPYRLKW